MGGAAFGVMLLIAGCGRYGFDDRDRLDAGAGDGNVSGDALDADGMVPAVGSTVVRTTSLGGAGNEDLYDIAVASDGTVVGTGTTDGGSFSVGSDVITSAGGEDILITVFEADGTPRWARRIGSAGGDRGQAVVIDGDTIYVCGLFAGSVDFGGGAVAAAGMWDVFVASYTLANGTYRWHRALGGTGADFCYDLDVAPDGSIVATGYYVGAIDAGPSVLPAAGDREIFVARYTGGDGAPLAARGFASTGSDSGQGVAVTATGNVVVTGVMGGAIDFGDGAKGAAGHSFLVELDSGFEHMWSRSLGPQTAWDVAIDRPRDRIVVASRTTAGLDLGSGPLPAAGGADNLILSYSSARELEWYRSFGGELSDIGLGISVDASGNAYSIGLGGTDIDFGLGLVTGHAGNQDIWVAAHDRAGTVHWGRMYGGTPQDRGYATAVAPDGALYVAGRWAGTTDFGTGPVTATANDLFLLRIE